MAGGCLAGLLLQGLSGLRSSKKGIATLKPMAGQAQMAMLNPAMRPQENTVVKAIAFSIAGILLVLPGILSDIVAMLVLLPAVQNKFKALAKDYATKNPEKLMQMVSSGFGNTNNASGSKFGTTVDGKAKTVNGNAKRITRSANDD